MPSVNTLLSADHQAVVERFIAACHADSRVVAAFPGGSQLTGQADVYADLNLYLIVMNKDYDDVLAGRIRSN